MSRQRKREAARSARIAAALALTAALAGCSLLPKEESALAPPLVKPAQENYRTSTAERGSISIDLNGTGYFESEHTEVAQFTGQSGRVQEVLAHSGDTVKKGDLLVQLVMDDLDLQVKEQQLELEKAKYNLKQQRMNPDIDEELVRMAELQAQIEQMKYDRLVAQYDSKQLKAGMDGEVVFVEDVKPGDYVDTYQTLVIIADPKQVRLSMNTEGNDTARDVGVGFAADVGVSLEGKRYDLKGKVVQTPSSAPQTLNKDLADKYGKTIYIQVDDVPDGVDIGSMADVKIAIQRKDDVVKIPRSGLRNEFGRTYVRTMDAEGKMREVDVETGLMSPTEVEIVKGLKEGDVIIQQ